MKNLTFTTLSLIFTLFIFQSSFAQDVIVLRNGDEIKAKVEEVGLETVRYKNYDNQQGPVYTLRKAEIFMIKYENGTRDVFSTEDSGTTTEQQTKSPPPVQSREYMDTYQYHEAIRTIQKGRRLLGFSIPMFVTGGILIGVGALAISDSHAYWDPIDGYYDEILWRNGVIMTTIGSAMFVASIPMFAVGVNRLSSGRSNLRAIESNRASLGITPVFSANGNGGLYSGFHLKLSF